MKQLAISFAQLAAIIMVLLTLAVWTAAFSQWTTTDGSAAGTRNAQPQAALTSDLR